MRLVPAATIPALLIAGAAAAIVLLLPNASASSAIVPTRFDDPPPNGCQPNDCSLREAIIAANDNPGPDAIEVEPGTYNLAIEETTVRKTQGFDPDRDNISLIGDLDITDDLTLIGAGTTATVIDGNGNQTRDRVLDVFDANVTISHLTIRDGFIQGVVGVCMAGEFCGEGGGGLRNNTANLTLDHVLVTENSIAGLNSALQGGGIQNRGNGTLLIVDSAISNNIADGGGGGIDNREGTLTVLRSTISENASNGEAQGGGIQNSGTAYITNSTISGNTAEATGGGIHSRINPIVMSSSTITNNISNSDADTDGDGGAGGVHIQSGTATIKNTIIAGNNAIGGASEDCFGTFNSQRYNMIGEITACTLQFDLMSSIVGDPLLGPLADNGGPTLTHALASGSPARNAANPTGCNDHTGVQLPTDQRGGDRDVGGRCDIGAYEFGASPATPTPSPTPIATPTPSPSPGITPTKMVCTGPEGGEVSDGVGTISAVLTTVDDIPLAGLQITWTDLPGLSSVSPDSSITDATGSAETMYGVPADGGFEGEETVTASFAGNSQYGPSTCETTFHVESSHLPTPTPTPTPQPDALIQGDNDCDGDEDAVDALVSLQSNAGLPYNQQPDCPALGNTVIVPAGAVVARIFGDIDCDSDVDAVDALGILRDVAGLPVNQNEPCPAIGEPL